MTSKKENLAILSAFGALIVAMLTAAALPTSVGTASADQHENSTLTTTQTQNATGATISAGRGNLTVSYNEFYPMELEINSGESVTFINPTPEIHSVVFDLSNGTIISDIFLPFAVSGDPEFTLGQPYNFGEPIVETSENGTQTIITLNKAAFLPTVLDESGTMQDLNGTDVSYSATGNEQIISSGLLGPTEEELEAMFMAAFPEEMMAEEEPAMNATATEEGAEEEGYQPVIPSVNRFSVTFDQAGTYEFFCPFHPAMYGEITVN